MTVFEYARRGRGADARTLSAGAVFDRLGETLVDHGEYVLRQVGRMEGDEERLRRLLVEGGYLEERGPDDYRVAGRGLRRLQDRALRDLFVTPNRGGPGLHATGQGGEGLPRYEDSRPYVYGDPLAALDVPATLRLALGRGPAGGRLRLAESDLVVHEPEDQSRCATVLLLDQSGSMTRFHKFREARRVALALFGLVRRHYRGDTLELVGFFTRAERLSERDLLRVRPKPVGLFDPRRPWRAPLKALPPDLPEQFTNIQAGLRLARELLRGAAAPNKQILCVTDGEPTAYLDGEELVLSYPPTEATVRGTLDEVRRCRREGIRLSTFALVDDGGEPGLKNFAARMARESQGVALTCTAGRLGRLLLERFVHGQRLRPSTR